MAENKSFIDFNKLSKIAEKDAVKYYSMGKKSAVKKISNYIIG